jgi:Fe-S-cluster containining protein
MKDGLLRRIIKRLARLRYDFDLGATRLLLRRRGEPRYRLTGACNGCGRCCESPTLAVSRPVFYLRSLRALVLGWHRLINGFEYVSEDRRHRLFVLRCTHYDPQTKQCDSYDSRPGMCRDYPRNLLYEAIPEFLPECGFGAVDKNAARFRSALEQTNLTPEQRRDLEKKLRLFE